MQVIKITATGSILAGKTILNGLILVPGNATATIILDDSLAGSGTMKAAASCVANVSSPNSIPTETIFETGVYATLTGAGAVAYAFIA